MASRLRRLCRPLPVLLAVSALALAVRLFRLGTRVAHQDEGRLADWILAYMRTGTWQYRAIIHGGFLPHVVPYVFQAFGPSDFTMRLVPAVVGAALPLCAYLYRDHLRDDEVIVFGLLLAASPPLLYYTRFLRYDPLVAASMMATVGFWLRAKASGKVRYLFAGTFVFALAFTMKENALLYPVAWLGALVLVADRHLVVGLARGTGPLRTVADAGRSWLDGVDAQTARRWIAAIVGAAALWLVVVAAFYAPIPELYGAFGSVDTFVHIASESTIGTWNSFVGTWAGSNLSNHSILWFLGRFLHILVTTATVTCAFAVVGFAVDRYSEGSSRDLVGFCFYWGTASILGYAIVMDVLGGWAAVHIVAPLTLPAAVGIAWLYRLGADAYRSDDRVGFTVAAVVLLLAGAAVGATAVQTSYRHDQSPSNPLVQYAQPAGHMKPTLHEIRDRSAGHAGIDVLFYGDEFYTPGELDSPAHLSVANGTYQSWFERLPLPWYFDRYGVRVGSTKNRSTIEQYDPPAVITLQKNANAVRSALDTDKYTERTYQGYQSGRPLVFFVRDGGGTDAGATNATATPNASVAATPNAV